MTANPEKTLRLLMPQWQGGDVPAYHLGARLLSWLAPPASGPVVEVDVAPPTGESPPIEDGVVGRGALLAQLRSAGEIIARHAPDRIVVLGGDCLVDLAPIAYLNERYDGDLAVLWVDAHPDVMTPKQYARAHAMVLGNLLGEGDPDFVRAVARPLRPSQVMYAGMDEKSEYERDFIRRHGLRVATPAELAESSEPVLSWLRSLGASRLAIHFDLDALDPSGFRSLYFTDPKAPPEAFAGIPKGKMSIEQVVRVLSDAARSVPVVGLGVTEHLPWDAVALKTMLERLPLIGEPA